MDRQTDTAHHFIMIPPYGGRGNKNRSKSNHSTCSWLLAIGRWASSGRQCWLANGSLIWCSRTWVLRGCRGDIGTRKRDWCGSSWNWWTRTGTVRVCSGRSRRQRCCASRYVSWTRCGSRGHVRPCRHRWWDTLSSWDWRRFTSRFTSRSAGRIWSSGELMR